MATVEKNNRIQIMKFNNFVDNRIIIQIMDADENTCLLSDEDVKFLESILSKWLKEQKEEAGELNYT